MAVGIDTGERVESGEEGVLDGNGPVPVKAVNLAVGLTEVLCLMAEPAIPDGKVESMLSVKNDAGSVVVAGGLIGLARGLKDDLLVDPSIVANPTPDDSRHG